MIANLQFWSLFSLRSDWFHFLNLPFVIHSHTKERERERPEPVISPASVFILIVGELPNHAQGKISPGL